MAKLVGFIIVVGAIVAFPPIGFVILFLVGMAMLGSD